MGAGGPDSAPALQELAKKVAYLETDLDTITKQVAQLQEEHQFMQRLLEDPTKRQSPSKGSSGTSGG
jgi:chaperonin cofactor prefoldin